jgi:glycosyltransferase involved in cell wall biosynthesis
MPRQNTPILGIVAPCYNEEAILNDTGNKLLHLLKDLKQKNIIAADSFIAFVDDGSADKTWQIIEYLHTQHPEIAGLKLAKNAGHQRALLAGLLQFKDRADCIISIDADLQDDISVIEEMLGKFAEGYEIVYGVRKERNTDSFFKKQTALLFYKLIRLMRVKVVYNHADFRLASKRVLDALAQFRERNLFLRGIFPTIGFQPVNVYYNRQERLAGETKYPVRKMISFAWEGVTSFSITPLRLVTVMGFVVFFISMLLSAYAFASYFQGKVIVGWVSTVIPMYFLGGIQLLCIGIIGEYIGKIYIEVKDRPRYIIDKILD